jgi:hypothetical protein
MKLVLRRAGEAATLFGAVLLVAMSAGCTEETTGFYIQGNVKIDSPECIARAESSSTLLFTGALDVALKHDYEATLLVGSQLAPRGDKTNLRTETMVATITGAEVHLYNDVGELRTEFTVPSTGVITPSSGDDPGFGVMTAILVPETTGRELEAELTDFRERRTLVAEVMVFGKTIGGLDVESSPFTYVVEVCEGCRVLFPADAVMMDPMTGAAFCGATDEALTPPCRLGQDELVDCRLCSGSSAFCVFPGGAPPP